MNNFNYESLKKLRNSIWNLYCNIYSDYEIKKPKDLEEHEDMTLDFVSCTICLAKKNIRLRKKDNSYILLQPCLRNNNVEALSKPSEKLDYMNYFTMMGGYKYIDSDNWINEFNEIVQRQFKFFTTLYNNVKVRLTIPKQYCDKLPILPDTIKLIKANNGKIVYSTDDLENLKWQYGINGIEGYGTRWELEDINGNYINCGNDIILFDNKVPIGIDFGSGLETLVAVKTGKSNLLYANIVCDDYIKRVGEDNFLNEKLINSLTSLICCIKYKTKLSLRVKNVINSYIRIISSILIINEISDYTLCKIITNICKNLYIKDEVILSEILNKVKFQQSFLNEISAYNLSKECTNLFDIEICAIELINERKKEYEKAKTIKKRR